MESIQSMPGMASYCAAVASGVQPLNFKQQAIAHSDVSLQVAPTVVPRTEGTTTIGAWNRYAHLQPTGPTIGYVSPWWQGMECKMYFLEFWKKSLDEQIEGLISETATQSTTYKWEWQGVIAAAEAAATREAQIAIQMREDATEA